MNYTYYESALAIMKTPGFYDMCYVCFSKKELVPCKRCVYNICRHCILDEKMSRARLAVCDHPDCEHERPCGKCEIDIVFTCGTCQLRSEIKLTELMDAIRTTTVNSPKRTWTKKVIGIDEQILFFNILDLDTGVFKLEQAWTD